MFVHVKEFAKKLSVKFCGIMLGSLRGEIYESNCWHMYEGQRMNTIAYPEPG